MPEIREITEMCRAGRVQDAYELARSALNAAPEYPWLHSALGWALYYLIKTDSELGNYDSLQAHLEEINSLNLLSIQNDSMIFDNVQLKIADYIKKHVPTTDLAYSDKLSRLFSLLNGYAFRPSRGHSYLLQSFIKFEQWAEMADFIDWWNLGNLREDDYQPYVNQRGQRMIALAERAYIAYSKALIRIRDIERINIFLPKLEALMNEHSEMLYPGYYYGKLLITLGCNADEALRVIIPFARRKATEFWVWQLLSDLFANDVEKQLACLLRAVHCRTQETFLGRVRMKLAELYINSNRYNCAHLHIEAIVRCYLSQGWHVPYQVDNWLHQPWFNTSIPEIDTMDYQTITEEILCNGAEECIAIVTYYDQNTRRTSMIFGLKQKMSKRVRLNVNVGDVVKLYYIRDPNNNIKILRATMDSLPNNLEYGKNIEGVVEKREGQNFAFIRSATLSCYVSPNLVNDSNLQNGENVNCLAVYDYNRRKDTWSWTCVKIN